MSPPQRLTYLFLEGDVFQREKAIARVSAEHFPDQDVDRKIFKADEGRLARALEEVCSGSLFSEPRVVILAGLDTVFTKKSRRRGGEEEASNGLSESEMKWLLDCLAHPRGETPFLLFAESGKNLPPGILDALGKKGVQVLPKTTSRQIREAVLHRCQKAQVKFHPEALRYFMELCSDNAEAALHEINKILLWAESGQEISLEDCEALMQVEKEEIIWNLADAVRQREIETALTALARLLGQGHEPIAAMAVLAATFRNLHLFKSLLAENIPKPDWPSYSRLKGYPLTKSLEQCQSYSLDQLHRALALFRHADEDMKGGKSDARLVVERLVLDLCRI